MVQPKVLMKKEAVDGPKGKQFRSSYKICGPKVEK